MFAVFSIAKMTAWLASLVSWATTATSAVTSGQGLAEAVRATAAKARGLVTGSASQALVIAAVTLVALFGYTWFVMHVQYGWDNSAVVAGLAKKNKELGDVNTVEAARVAGNDATRAGQVITVFRTIEVEKPVPGPTQVVTVTQPGPSVPYAVPGNCPVTEAHRLADTPADLRRQLNAIK